MNRAAPCLVGLALTNLFSGCTDEPVNIDAERGGRMEAESFVRSSLLSFPELYPVHEVVVTPETGRYHARGCEAITGDSKDLPYSQAHPVYSSCPDCNGDAPPPMEIELTAAHCEGMVFPTMCEVRGDVGGTSVVSQLVFEDGVYKLLSLKLDGTLVFGSEDGTILPEQALPGLSAQPGESRPWRRWHSSTGEVQLVGRLRYIEYGRAVIEPRDGGQRVRFDLALMSDEDRDYLIEVRHSRLRSAP